MRLLVDKLRDQFASSAQVCVREREREVYDVASVALRFAADCGRVVLCKKKYLLSEISVSEHNT